MATRKSSASTEETLERPARVSLTSSHTKQKPPLWPGLSCSRHALTGRVSTLQGLFGSRPPAYWPANKGRDPITAPHRLCHSDSAPFSRPIKTLVPPSRCSTLFYKVSGLPCPPRPHQSCLYRRVLTDVWPRERAAEPVVLRLFKSKFGDRPGGVKALRVCIIRDRGLVGTAVCI